MAKEIVFIDLEVSEKEQRAVDYGAAKDHNRLLHTKSQCWKGYIVSSAEIRFIVAWKGEEDEAESNIILPDIHLSRFEDDASLNENVKMY